jgi:hypothetical protein
MTTYRIELLSRLAAFSHLIDGRDTVRTTLAIVVGYSPRRVTAIAGRVEGGLGSLAALISAVFLRDTLWATLPLSHETARWITAISSGVESGLLVRAALCVLDAVLGSRRSATRSPAKLIPRVVWATFRVFGTLFGVLIAACVTTD